MNFEDNNSNIVNNGSETEFEMKDSPTKKTWDPDEFTGKSVTKTFPSRKFEGRSFHWWISWTVKKEVKIFHKLSDNREGNTSQLIFLWPS